MRIALGTTVLHRGLAEGGVDGIGKYTYELMLRLMGRQDLELNCYSHGFKSELPGVTQHFEAGPFQSQALYSLLTSQAFPAMAKRAERSQVVHAPDHLIPSMKNTPVIATVMDAIPLSHPEWVGYRFRRSKNWAWKRSVNWAQHVITISEYSRSELIKWFDLPEERVTAIPLGVDDRWFSAPAADELKEVADRYELPSNYLIVVGTLQPRKNLRRVIEAHQRLAQSIRSEVPLVVVGRPGWCCDDEIGMLNSASDGSMRWLRYVPDSDLLSLVAGADALVFASLYEGFGLPVLEAFATGVPVIASNTSSLPEVAGDAALLVDPCDVDEIAAAMLRVIEDRVLGRDLRARGLQRARQYTWDRTAAMTVDVYRRVLEE